MKALMCVEGEVSVRPLVRPNWTVPVRHLVGRHTAGMRTSAPSLQWSLFSPNCCGGGTRLFLTRSPSTNSICLWPGHQQSLCTLSAANKDHIKLGYLWTVAVD